MISPNLLLELLANEIVVSRISFLELKTGYVNEASVKSATSIV